MNITITGSRDFDRHDILKVYKAIRPLIGKKNKWFIGGARGIDNVVLQFLLMYCENCIVVVPFTIDKQPKECRRNISKATKIIELDLSCSNKRELKSNYKKRNIYMIDDCEADLVLAFYNGKKGGTYNTFTYAKEKGIKTKIIKIRPLDEKSVD